MLAFVEYGVVENLVNSVVRGNDARIDAETVMMNKLRVYHE